MGHSDSDGRSVRLSILVTSTQRRGAEIFGEQLASGLSAKDWVVDFIALGGSPSDAPTIDADPLSRTPVGRLDPRVVRRLRSRLAASGAEVVLANGSSTLQYSVAAVRTLRHRPRLAYASIGEPAYWADTPRRRLTYRALLTFVDQVFSVSGPTAEQLTKQFGVSNDRLRVLPTGVPDQFFAVERQPTAPELRILFLGSLSAEKDPMAAVGILDHLSGDTPAILRMVGGGPLAGELLGRARTADAAHTLELTGSVEDIRPHLAWADVLLLTSRTEGLPAAILEAAAAGIPTVAFDVGGVAEAVRDRATGCLVRAGDLVGAAEALAEYATDSTTRQLHGSAARDLAEASFTMDAAITRYDRALRELAEGAATT